ncbi:MAG TPA: serine/threonine-protein kinase, partial [Thermoanaerobaculia bacterium]|nr:serine/threonine-protein kinase [Thermoanaerobaculia bacterium]
MIGTNLGPYAITAAIGAGGMGEVYRATDTKLEREVAIKVLPAAFTEDPERLARFEREAKLLAQLHHPHIASIFGLEESGGAPALVMELVPGPTLAERLAQGPIPLDEALPIARQIAEALEYAHEHGIIHRDLKPANIKINGEDQVKILDFGLAKAMDTGSGAEVGSGSVDLSHSPTMTLGATVQGMILGTAGYMAPEQARGSAVDKRADIWAFGVVLYEMLTGKRLFQAESVPDTLAGVLKGEIDLESLPDDVPAALRHLLRRCLQRTSKNRLRDIGEARIALDAIAAGDSEEGSGAIVETGLPRRRALWLGLAGGVVLGALIALGSVHLGGGSLTAAGAPAAAESARPVKFRIELPEGTRLGHEQISPDGRAIAWVSGNALWVRHLDQFDARR